MGSKFKIQSKMNYLITYDTFTQWKIIKPLKPVATPKIFLVKCKVNWEDGKCKIYMCKENTMGRKMEKSKWFCETLIWDTFFSLSEVNVML